MLHGYLSGTRCRLAYGPAHCHSLSLASVKSRLVLPLWYRLTWVVLDKGPLNGRVCVLYSLFLTLLHVCLLCGLQYRLSTLIRLTVPMCRILQCANCGFLSAPSASLESESLSLQQHITATANQHFTQTTTQQTGGQTILAKG